MPRWEIAFLYKQSCLRLLLNPVEIGIKFNYKLFKKLIAIFLGYGIIKAGP